jgi:hypothetical protein
VEKGALEAIGSEAAHRGAEADRTDWGLKPVRRPYEAACASKEPIGGNGDQSECFNDGRLAGVVNADDDRCVAEGNAMVFKAAKVFETETCDQD